MGRHVGGGSVDKPRDTLWITRPGSVDAPGPIPRGVPRAPVDLWEPGDTTGTAIGHLTCEDGPSSTVHSPYYHYHLE
jgi:hypothetical protein